MGKQKKLEDLDPRFITPAIEIRTALLRGDEVYLVNPQTGETKRFEYKAA